MPADTLSREALLLKIKAAEKEAIKREEIARNKASQMREKSQKEASKIIESSEDEGRKLLRSKVDSSRKELDAIRQEMLRAAEERSATLNSQVVKRMPQVTDWMLTNFKKEYDVKN